MEHFPAVVIGGGQAGLSASFELKARGVEHLLLDRGRVGDSWRSRWDSFHLVTQSWQCRLPGFPAQVDPHSFMSREAIIAHLEAYAESFEPPLRQGVEVTSLSRSPDHRLVLETTARTITADHVVVATGTFQQPRIPEALSSGLPPHIDQLHSAQYRNPESLRPGGVVVVGSGQSGSQIARELFEAGRDVHLCVGSSPRLPRRYRGRDIFEWIDVLGLLDLTVDEHPGGECIRFEPNPHLQAGRTLHLRKLARQGLELHGRLVKIEGSRVSFANDLGRMLDQADDAETTFTTLIDLYIEREGIHAPPASLLQETWSPAPHRPHQLDLEERGISTLLWATGYRLDFERWIDIEGVLGARGYPRVERGVSLIQGLYFLGLHWMHTWGSGLLHGVGKDAAYLAGIIASHTYDA